MESQPEIDYKKRLRPKTYSITVYVVGIFLIVEVIFLGLVVWFRHQARVRIEKDGPAVPPAAQIVVPASEQPESELPALNTPEGSGRLALPANATVQDRINRFNEEARSFQQNGDFTMAEGALKQALELKPDDLLTWTNLAFLEQAKGNNQGAVDAWKKIISIAPENDKTVKLAKERAALLEENMRLEAEAKMREQNLLAAGTRKIFVDTIKMTPETAASGASEVEADFVLKLDADSANFDSSKLRIQVFVYSQTPDGPLEPAKIDASFLNNPPDWKSETGESLRIKYSKYLQPPDTPEDRSYYGYLIRLYYDDELQDQKAEPARLLELFPPDEKEKGKG